MTIGPRHRHGWRESSRRSGGQSLQRLPRQPHSMFMRMQVVMKRLAEYEGVLRKLERQAHHDATGSIPPAARRMPGKVLTLMREQS